MSYDNFTNYEDNQLLDLHQEARDAYYGTGDDIMTDAEFNALELELDNRGLEYQHGTDKTYGDEMTHPTSMFSLKKFNINRDETNLESLYNQMIVYFNQHPDFDVYNADLSLEYKWDGLPVNCVVENGHITAAITRGKYTYGRNVFDKVCNALPLTIDNNNVTELRGEIMVPLSVFDSKYVESGYAHPRALAVGILGNQDVNDKRIHDLVFKAHGAKINDNVINDTMQMIDCIKFGPTMTDYSFINGEVEFTDLSFNGFKAAYEKLRDNRANIDLPTDGIVVKFTQPYDGSHEPDTIDDVSDGHYPYYAVAFKFPTKAFKTKVTKIVWNRKPSGKYIPNIRFESSVVDGRSIGKISGVNWDWVENKGLWPGAEIQVDIRGDIIPFLYAIDKPCFEYDTSLLPEDLEVRGKHAYVGDGSYIEKLKCTASISRIGFKDLGWQSFKLLAEFVDYKWYRVFTLNEDDVRPILKNSKAKKFAARMNELEQTGIDFEKVLSCMMFNGLGSRTIREISKEIEFDNGNFKGLVKRDIEHVLNGDGRKEFDIARNYIKNFVTINPPKPDVQQTASTLYVLTGSPKPHFKTKAEFNKYMTEHSNGTWGQIGKLQAGSTLITDDLESNTSKMKQARKLGCNIITYKQAINAIYGENA